MCVWKWCCDVEWNDGIGWCRLIGEVGEDYVSCNCCWKWEWCCVNFVYCFDFILLEGYGFL